MLLLLLPVVSIAGDFGVNVYGASYHFERSRAKQLGLDNEFNPVAAYDWRAVTLNVTCFPRASHFNDLNTLGFWLTFPLANR